MNLAVLLHFYQPFNQQDDILDRIVNECYLPLTEGLLATPRAKITANISGGLIELLLAKNYVQVLDNLKKLADAGQIEFTGSAMYHPMLPLIPESETLRQIELNDAANKKIFGDKYNPKGFFSPEMAVSAEVLNLVKRKGYEWIAAPSLSHPTGAPRTDRLYSEESGINILFRNKRVSALLLSAVCRDITNVIEETSDLHGDKYCFVVMDAETFGHHRIGHEKALIDILNHEFFAPITGSEVIKMLKTPDISSEIVALRPCTWTNEEQDFWLDKENTFILWKDPENPIHKIQWDFFDYVVKLVLGYPDKQKPLWSEARNLLDRAISSDQFWWASAKPWWSLEMIEQGAYALKEVAIKLEVEVQHMQIIDKMYYSILDKAFEWQRTGYIRKRHLKDSSTYKQDPFSVRAPQEWYNQMILEFEDQMNLSAKNRDYEKAIKWRDALIKLKLKTDVYDVLHVVDELWSARNIPLVKPFYTHTWEEFSAFAKDNFLGIKTKEDFEKFKQEKLKKGFK